MTNMGFCFLKTQTLSRTTKNQMSTNFLNHVKPRSKSSLSQTGASIPVCFLSLSNLAWDSLEYGGPQQKPHTEPVLWRPQWLMEVEVEGALSMKTYRKQWGQNSQASNSLMQDELWALLMDSWESRAPVPGSQMCKVTHEGPVPLQ